MALVTLSGMVLQTERVEIELNPGERRLYDRVRGKVRRPRPGASSGVWDTLLLLPDLTMLMARLIRDPRVRLLDKALAALGVGYVLSPIDLLPTFIFGPLGLVDDLFVVSAGLSRLVNHVHPDVVRSHWSGQGDALAAIHRATAWCEHQLRNPGKRGRS